MLILSGFSVSGPEVYKVRWDVELKYEELNATHPFHSISKGWAHQAATHVAYSCHTHAEKVVFINHPFLWYRLEKKDTPASKWYLEHSSGLCEHFLAQWRWEVCIFCFKGKPAYFFRIEIMFPKINGIQNYLVLTVCWRCGSPPSHIGRPPGREGGWGEGRRRRKCVGGQVASHCISSSSSFNILSLQ